MRAHALKEYDSVLQVLSEPGCPLCAFLKNVQSRLLQEGRVGEFVALCNVHAWALAAIRDSGSAAKILLSLMGSTPEQQHRECSVCIRLDQEEVLRVQEFLAAFERRNVLEWIRRRGVLCLQHGRKLRAEASESARILIDQILDKRRSELKQALAGFLVDSQHGETEHGGALGKAAEYLVSQRGLSLRSGDAIQRVEQSIR